MNDSLSVLLRILDIIDWTYKKNFYSTISLYINAFICNIIKKKYDLTVYELVFHISNNSTNKIVYTIPYTMSLWTLKLYI